MNIIHYMHDKYAYEKMPDGAPRHARCRRLMAFGIAGMSCMADSLSAIKYAKVRCVRNKETGLVTEFEIEGEYPAFGNDDDRVDAIACEQMKKFYESLKKNELYRGARPYAVGADDYFQCHVWEKDRQARRTEERRASR